MGDKLWERFVRVPDKHYKLTRLHGYDYSTPGVYFVTLCAWKRECRFGEIEGQRMSLNDPGEIISDWWQKLQARYENVILDEYIIMPNHLHGIITIASERNPPIGEPHHVAQAYKFNYKQPREMDIFERRKMLLSKIIGYFKMNSSKQINLIHKSPGVPLWQKNYFEHIIRNKKDLDRIRKYIRTNPSHWDQDHNNPNRP